MRSGRKICADRCPLVPPRSHARILFHMEAGFPDANSAALARSYGRLASITLSEIAHSCMRSRVRMLEEGRTQVLETVLDATCLLHVLFQGSRGKEFIVPRD
jgi:hypothetical protein